MSVKETRKRDKEEGESVVREKASSTGRKGRTETSRSGSRQRAGQYAQAGHGGGYGSEMISKERTGRPGRPGGRGWREVPWDLPLSGPLAEPLKVIPGEFLEEPLGGPGVRGGQSEEKLSLPLKVPLLAPLLLTV